MAKTLDIGDYAMATFLSDELAKIHRGESGPVKVACFRDTEDVAPLPLNHPREP